MDLREYPYQKLSSIEQRDNTSKAKIISFVRIPRTWLQFLQVVLYRYQELYAVGINNSLASPSTGVNSGQDYLRINAAFFPASIYKSTIAALWKTLAVLGLFIAKGPEPPEWL